MRKSSMNATKESVKFCQKLATQYEAEAAEYEAKALTCKPKQRGAYLSHALQKQKSALRMKANEVAQMAWLAEFEPALWMELMGSENEPV